jgi:O-antigen/teichoic acid export membrane protein
VADGPTALRERLRRSPLGSIGVSSVVAASLATLLHVVAGRELGADGYAHFLVVWGLFFMLTGILPGLQQEVIRTVASARLHDLDGHRPVVGSVVIAAGGLVLIAVLSPLWAPPLLDQQAYAVAGALALGFGCYAWANHVNGTLAATHRLRLYARTILIDGVLRFVFVGGVLVVGTGSLGWALALAAPTLTWALLATSSEVRAATMAPGDASTAAFVRRSAHSMLSAACSAVVVAGFPVLLQLWGGGADHGPAAGSVLAVLMATRAPLLLFLNAYQGVAITRLVDSRSPTRLMSRWVTWGTLLSIPSAVLGYVAGPSVLRLVFGPSYHATGWLFVELVGSGLVLGVITLTGWTALALGRHTVFVSGWLVTVVATSALLTVPISLQGRVSLALVLGPLAGTTVHLVALRYGSGDVTSRDARAPYSTPTL